MDPYRIYTTEPNPLRLVGHTQPVLKTSLADLGYDETEQQSLKKEFDLLFKRYGGSICFGARHRAACSVWRSERLLLGSEALPRFANRVHIFQGRARAGKDDDFGAFLGYLSLRPQRVQADQHYPFTAVAYLGPPRYMLRPRYHILTTPIGAGAGLVPFRAAPYCRPNADTESRASCLHSSLQAALWLKMHRFGCIPISAQDLLAVLWKMNGGKQTMVEISRNPPSLDKAKAVLERPEVQAGAIFETIGDDKLAPQVGSLKKVDSSLNDITIKDVAMLETHYCLTDYLSNGLPVIVEVPAAGKAESMHAILLLGMHLLQDPEDSGYRLLDFLKGRKNSRVDVAELPGRFVVHDINAGPYVEISAATLLRHAWISKDPKGKDLPTEEHAFHFLVLAPKGTNMGISAVRRLARGCTCGLSAEYWRDYLKAFHLTDWEPKKSSGYRIVTRLFETAELVNHYFPPDNREEAIAALNNTRVNHNNYWWAAECRLPWAKSRQTHFPAASVWFWSTTQDPDNQEDNAPLGVVSWAGDDNLRCQIGDSHGFTYAFAQG